MEDDRLTGSRIRERRVIQGTKQAELAKQIGISASYLNLIEHNRRRIGGKLLLSIAAALEVEPTALTEGAGVSLLGVLGEAAAAADMSAPRATDAGAFAARFPDWAQVLAASQQRVADLERTVETLSNRMTHDPHLAEAMHELLTTAAAVRSTAEILAADSTLEQEWRDRFHANLDADSSRLAQSAQGLVGYLENAKSPAATTRAPHDEVEAYLAVHDFCFEKITAAAPARAPAPARAQMSEAAHFMLDAVLAQMGAQAQLLPLEVLAEAVQTQGTDPATLARHLCVPLEAVLYRLAALPELGAGLVVCDRAGAVIFRKPVAGFSVPRLDSCCPLWPLFAALGAPATVLYQRIGQLGAAQVQFDAYAVAQANAPAQAQGQASEQGPEASLYNTPAPLRAVMLLLPVRAGEVSAPVVPVGATCRICRHGACGARRTPSILQGTQ